MDRNLQVDREVLFFAFRYALGRMSYAPNVVMDNMRANLSKLSIGDLKAYIREISECESYGMSMDEREWLSFKKELETEVKRREEETKP